jgi:two-component system phosphate regulon response regulator OmpR
MATMTPMPHKILVVDDDLRLRDLLKRYLSEQGFAADTVPDATAMDRQMGRVRYDLVVLDLMMPGEDGFAVCRRLRAVDSAIGIVMLTARGGDIDRIAGLETGADDYIAKPFNPRELVARCKAILRRMDPTVRGSRPMEVGDLRVDPRRREAILAGRRLDLRPREFDLLAALARDPGVVWTRDDLLESVWGTDFPGETRTVDVHVSALRSRMGPEGPAIEAVKGVGYRLVPPARDGT